MLHSRIQALVEESGGDFRLAFDEPSWIISQVLSLGNTTIASALVDRLHKAGITYEDSLGPGALALLRNSGLLDRGDWEKGTCQVPASHPLEAWCRPGIITAQDAGKALVLQLAGLAEPGTKTTSPGTPDTTPSSGTSSALSDLPVSPGTTPRSPRSEKDLLALSTLRTLEERRRKPSRVFLLLSLPQGLAGAPVEWIESWISRRILALPACQGLLRVQDSFHGLKERRDFLGAWYGHGIWTVSFDAGPDGRSFVQGLEEGLASLEARILEKFDPSSPGLITASLALPGLGFEARSPGEKTLRSSIQNALAKAHVQATLTGQPDGFAFAVAAKMERKSSLKDLTFNWQGEAGLPILQMRVMSRFGIRSFLDQGLGGGAFRPVHIKLEPGV